MAKFSAYCKAYPESLLREFDGWAAVATTNREPEVSPNEGSSSGEVNDEKYYFLHDNYVVTADIVNDEQIIFDRITPEWITFCKNQLKFEIPEGVVLTTPETEASSLPVETHV